MIGPDNQMKLGQTPEEIALRALKGEVPLKTARFMLKVFDRIDSVYNVGTKAVRAIQRSAVSINSRLRR